MRNDIVGGITDDELIQAKVDLDSVDAPQIDRFFYVSPNQQGNILKIDRFSNVEFIGPGPMPVRTGVMPSLYGAEPLIGTRVRRRLVSGNLRTVNFMFQREAYAIAMQQDVSTIINPVDLAWRHISWMLFGGVRTRNDHVSIMDTSQL